MRRIQWFILYWFSFLLIFPTAKSYDFAVDDVVIQKDFFISLKLRNLSKDDFKLNSEIKENIFLTIYLNNIKRVEYKIKYINKSFFYKNNSIIFKTNFRMFKNLNGTTIKIHLNPNKIIPESNYSNNTLEKKLYLNDNR